MSASALDKGGTLYFWQKIKNLFAEKGDAVKSITRVGETNTFTVTFADGTTTSFTTPDTIVEPSTAAPLMDGTEAIGSSLKYAREDHVHPKDTSKVDVTRTINGKPLSADVVLAPSDVNAVPAAAVGSSNGVCPLDDNALIASQYLPSYVDDVVEVYARTGATALASDWFSISGPTGDALTPQAGIIYVLMNAPTGYDINTQFRWGGTTYVKLNDGGIVPITNAEIDEIVAS